VADELKIKLKRRISQKINLITTRPQVMDAFDEAYRELVEEYKKEWSIRV